MKGIVSILNGIQDIFKNLFSYNPDPSFRQFDWNTCTWESQSESQSIIQDGKNTIIETNGEVIKLKGNPNVTIKNSKVYINGKEIDKSQYRTKHNHITVILEGDVENINSDGYDTDIYITGNVGNNVKSSIGDVKVEGVVYGNVSTTNGDIIVGRYPEG